jgi:lipoprotein-anchoring transpeptidase ErfK/SrfK
VPLRRSSLLLIPLAAIAIALTGWVGPAKAPPAGSHPQPVQIDRYESVVRSGAPVAILRRRTALRAAPGGRALAGAARRTEWGTPRVLPVVARSGQWLKVIATELPNGRYGWIRIGSAQLVANPWAVRADLSQRRVTVLRSGRVVRRFPVAVGKPGTPTPTGRFAVTDKLRLTSRSAAYGCCALALSGHQPRTGQGWVGGDRLAIHGTSEPQTIGRAASLGCLRARDRDVRWVVAHVWLGSLVDVRR